MAKTQSAGARDAIDMLMDDHKRVQKLFRDFESASRDDEETLRELVETACIELQIHSMLEEELFYPAVRARANDEQETLLNEAEVEHESVDELIAKLHELDASDPMYAAYFSVLSEYVKHHVKEEEKELFPQVKEMKELDLRQLGEDIRLRREELFAEMESDDGEDEVSEQRKDSVTATSDPTDEDEEELEDEQEKLDVSRTRH